MNHDLHTLPRRAAALIEENGWTQGTERDDSGALCLTGALRYCDQQPGDGSLIREVYARWDLTPGWNDSSDRTAEEVIGVLRRDITDADLAETFGPQWEQIVALVRRAAVLTPEECKALAAAGDAAGDAAGAAAWDAARAAAWSAAWSAAGDAARAAARDAAWSAAGDAAWAAAGAAAWDAARAAAGDAWAAAWAAAGAAAGAAAWALVVRDLIGQHGFTQEQYDVLVAPWVSVIGPVHPDDPS